MATLQDNDDDVSKPQETNVSESPGLRIEQKVVDDSEDKAIPHQENEKGSADQKGGAPEVTSDTGGVKITSSVEEEDQSKSSHPSLAEKFKDKFGHAAGSLKGQEDGLEDDPNPELAYETAAVTQPKPSVISKVKQTLGKGDKTPAAEDPTQNTNTGSKDEDDPNPEPAYETAADTHPKPSVISKVKQTLGKGDKAPAAEDPTQNTTTGSKDDEALSKDLGEKLDLKPSSESAASEGSAGEHQNQHPGFLQKIAHKIGLSSPKS